MKAVLYVYILLCLDRMHLICELLVTKAAMLLCTMIFHYGGTGQKKKDFFFRNSTKHLQGWCMAKTSSFAMLCLCEL